MRKELITHRARIRSRAILEPHEAALRALRGTDASSSAVPAASPSQALLEGLLFQSIRTLHFPWDDGPFSSWGGFLEILRLRPERDRLVIDLDPKGAAITIAEGALAYVLTDASPGEVHAPLLRPRATTEGVEFYRLGNPGTVLFRGVTLDDVITAYTERHHADTSKGKAGGGTDADSGSGPSAGPVDEVDLVWRTSPTTATTAELDNTNLPRTTDQQAALWVTSSVIRRLGMLIRLGATSIDTWEDTIRGVATVKVEAWYRDMTPAARDRLLRDLASPSLAPRWTYRLPRQMPDGIVDPYHYFTVAGTRHRVQLRLPIERS